MIFIAAIGLGFVITFVFAACKVAGDADRREEQFFKDDMDK